MRILIASLFFLTACSSSTTTVINNGIYDPCVSEACGTEPAFCSPSGGALSDPVTISGTAYFRKRLPTGSGLGGPSANKPIRYAEVAILDSNGNVLRCGETNASGVFSVNIERTSEAVRAEIRSRSYKSGQLLASVLDTPKTFNYYKIRSSAVSGNTNQGVGSVIAPYNSTLEGGAFNILDQLYEANAFLRTQTSGCTTFDANCPPLTQAPKVTAFWKAGFNPGTYLGNEANDTVSFYLAGTSRLYIVGGVNGDVNHSDTDHFDDSIILHEYGHFLEDKYAGSDSPGGEHNANSIIDPRLAWSEGWATYFALSVKGDPFYIDTKGNTDGTTGAYFYHNLDKNTPRRDPSNISYTVSPGEGVFREFAVVRSLLDMTDADCTSCGSSDYDNDGTQIDFAEFWTVFAGSSYFSAPSTRFRNASLFFKMHDQITNRTDITTPLEDEYMYHPTNATFLRHYATPITTGGCANTTTIKPANNNDRTEDGSFENSNQYASNDFYHLSHGGGALNLSLTHTGGLDLDLYLYKKDYIYGQGVSILGYSNNSGGSSESINFSNLSAGTYMINVMVYTGDLVSTSPALWPTGTYLLTINGSKVCL